MRNENDPPSAAWTYDASTGAPEDDYSKCFQLGCKIFRRREREGNATHVAPTDAAPRTDQMWDVIPSDCDTQGNEASLTVFLKSNHAKYGFERAEDLETDIRSGLEYLISPSSRHEFFPERIHATKLLHEYLAWYKSRVPVTEQRPADQYIDPGFISYDEHIAGPICVAENHAYSGYQISYEEMKACTTIQCLGHKESGMDSGNWMPLPDDEEFERTTEYCLSGLGDRPGALECDARCYPARHGDEDLMRGEFGGFRDGDLPFHPYCFEVYKRAPLFHKGSVDIDGLAEWFDRDGSQEIPHHPGVTSGEEQWWTHNHGDEFLFASPINVPALRDIFERATRTEPDFNTSNCAFEIDVATPERERDIFGRLPEELRNMILQPLGSKDIANLRRASSSFRKLPISLWYRLIQEDMPWLWEA